LIEKLHSLLAQFADLRYWCCGRSIAAQPLADFGWQEPQSVAAHLPKSKNDLKASHWSAIRTGAEHVGLFELLVKSGLEFVELNKMEYDGSLGKTNLIRD
jgi:hypothetical protein